MSGPREDGDPPGANDPPEGSPGTLRPPLGVGVDERLTFERQPFAKWTGAHADLRVIAMLILRWRRKRRGEWVPPIPWGMILVACVLVVLLALLAWGAGLLVAYLSSPVGG